MSGVPKFDIPLAYGVELPELYAGCPEDFLWDGPDI
jgi:hypothetical protein